MTTKNKLDICNVVITDYELDQLKESINIGASHASTALNQMIGRRVDITVPDVSVNTIEKAIEYVGQSDKVTTTILLEVLGEATGMMFFLLPGKSGNRLSHMITKSPTQNDVLSEYDRSALREVGNILSGAFLTALSNFLGVSMLHSVSEVVTDMLGSIINSVVAQLGKTSDVALIFKVNMKIEGEDICAQLYFMADPVFTGKILELTKKIA
jgi:chemotaxis protein CheC